MPRLVRHSLNLESGLNDGLALPAVLAFARGAERATRDFVWWHFVLQDVGLGFAYGIACGWIASLLMPRERALERAIPSHQNSLFALGAAFATYGVTVLPPEGQRPHRRVRRARSCSASAAPTCASTSSAAPTRSSRSSSSGSSSSSARC